MNSVQSTARPATRDYFELFRLPAGMDINAAQLSENFRILQRQFHPDRYASASAVEQRMAAQVSAELNAGYKVLSEPVSRAGYLLERAGLNLSDIERRPVAGDFLMRQMELREWLSELPAQDTDARTQLEAEIQSLYDEEISALCTRYEAGEIEAAAECWLHLLYINKLRAELNRREASL